MNFGGLFVVGLCIKLGLRIVLNILRRGILSRGIGRRSDNEFSKSFLLAVQCTLGKLIALISI